MMMKNIKKYAFVFMLIFGFFLLYSNSTQAAAVEIGVKSRCDIKVIADSYTKGCISCATVGTIISVFLDVGATAYPLMREAGNQLLLILTALWIAVFLLRNLSQFNAIELPDFMQQFGVFLFKVLVAFVCLNGGIDVILDYTLNPIISFGSDFAVSILSLASAEQISPDGVVILQDYMEVCYA